MGKKGFFGSLVAAIIMAVVVFFLVYFFAPSTASQFLGASFRSSKEASGMDAKLLDAANYVQQSLSDPAYQKQLSGDAASSGDAFSQDVKDLVSSSLKSVGEFTEEQAKKLEGYLKDPTTIEKLKKAAQKGGNTLQNEVKKLVEKVK